MTLPFLTAAPRRPRTALLLNVAAIALMTLAAACGGGGGGSSVSKDDAAVVNGEHVTRADLEAIRKRKKAERQARKRARSK